MSTRQTLALLSAGVLLAACAPGGAATGGDSTADISAIGKIRDQFMTSFKAGDAATIAAMYTSDGMTQSNMNPTGSGQQGITQSFTNFLSQMTIKEFTITPVKTEVSGNLAYEVGTYKFSAMMKPKNEPMNDGGRYTIVLRKENGTWKVIADMDNATAPPPGMPGMDMAPAKPAGKGETKKGG